MAKVGRPTKYSAEAVATATVLSAGGATEAEIAEALGVGLNTLYLWRASFPEFREAIKLAKYDADDRIERSLYERAHGYSHPDVDIRVVDGVIVKTDIVKHYPPDSTAMIFWLKNRRREAWRDVQKVEHSGTLTLASLVEQAIGVQPSADPQPESQETKH